MMQNFPSMTMTIYPLMQTLYPERKEEDDKPKKLDPASSSHPQASREKE